ncbi:HTH-type transcriptional regulator PgrR [Paraburkholderia ultramafica]|uniref:HTH-type transcriptional regulator PgrR n=1 Tax=Paraburkholderia ultramafica TaxID=1544867 RepID=A0A6S7CR15_9BURK|nr:LysR family transcriptional regulator [Paraburkholderia ultramafica]CAB3795787.1 HTH-type transcriptional regulator PgrR [Paraburkholderia ultramafica]
MMEPLTEMRAFVAVARLQSFTRAADSLGMTKARISRAIAHLETRSQARLFNRTTRRVCLTETARAYYECCESILAQIEAAELRLKSERQQLSGTLRLVVHPGAAASDLPRILVGYKARAPQVDLEISISDTRTDIVAGGYDIGILPPDLISNSTAVIRLIRRSQRILVASTSYLDSHGRPRVAADLCGHTLMHALDPVQRTERKLVLRKGSQTEECRIRSSLCANDSVLQMCAMASMGIALVPSDLVRDALRSGALEHVLPDHTADGAGTALCLAYPSRELMPASSRVFIDYCIGLLRPPSVDQWTAPGASIRPAVGAPAQHLWAEMMTDGSAR